MRKPLFYNTECLALCVSDQSQMQSESMCPLAEAALLLNSKWDLILIYNLMEEPLRFSQLKEKISAGITTPITSSSLTRILRKLESENLISRQINAEVGESVEITYELTDKGKALEQTIIEFKKWGTQYLVPH